MSSDFLPSREGDLVTWLGVFGAGITATPVALGLTAAQATAFTALNTTFVADYTAANNDATRTPAALVAKNLAKKAVVANARLLAGIVQKCPTVTDVQRTALGLKVHAVPTPIPPPANPPDVDVVSVSGFVVRVKLHDSASGTRRGRPPFVAGATLYTFVGAEPPASIDAWTSAGNTTKVVVDLVIPSSVAPGAKVWIIAQWYNAKAENSAASTPVSTNVQGGSVSAAA